MKHIESMIRKIELIDSTIGLNHFFSELKEIFHYSWAGLVVFEPSPSKSYIPNFLGQIPADMINLILRDDKIKRHCLNESKPINYRKLLVGTEWVKPSMAESNLFIGKQVELVVPINGFANEFACLIFAIPEQVVQPKMLEKIGWYWLILSTFIYSKYRENIKQNKVRISKRELECIRWAAEGKTSWEISQLLTISQRTVDFHLANCITKTDSVNRQQAIVKCVLNGQLLAV